MCIRDSIYLGIYSATVVAANHDIAEETLDTGKCRDRGKQAGRDQDFAADRNGPVVFDLILQAYRAPFC